MKTRISCLILLLVPAFARTAWGHGFNLFVTGIYGAYSINPQSVECQLDSDGVGIPTTAEQSNLFYEEFSGTVTQTYNGPAYTVPHGFVVTDGTWPLATNPGYPQIGWTATFNQISPLYYSDGTAGAVAASSGTSIQMNDAYYPIPVGSTYEGTSPGYVNINGSTPFYSGFQVSLDDPHEIYKELYIAPNSTQTYGEYGFAYDVTVTFNNGQTITTGPLTDVFATANFANTYAGGASDGQQDAATTAIYNAAISTGTTQLGTTSSWSGATNAAWNNAANWEAASSPAGPNGGIPGATSGTNSNDTVVFYSGTTTPVVDGGRNVQTILFETPNVGAMTFGTTTGNALLLTNGGSIQVTSWVVNPQVINAPLVLEGANALYTFNTDSTTASATLSFGGNISGGAAGSTVLTLGGDNTGANTISGAISNGAATSLGILESGPCNWILSGQNSYTGGTTVNQGTLTVIASGTLGSATSPLTISTAANGISAVVNINGNQSVGTLSGTILGANTTGTLNIAAGSSLTVNQAASESFGVTLSIAPGTLSSFGTFNFEGPNSLEIDAAPMLGANSAINVNGGTLRFNLASGLAVVGSGVTVSVASTATLQLAGSVSALSGGGKANIINNGATANLGGLSVTGMNQTVGTVTGMASTGTSVTTYAGDTVVGNGTSPASLTATQILQNSLTINAGSTVTIAPSGPGISNAAEIDGAESSSASLALDDSSIDSSSDADSALSEAIQSAVASGAVSSQTGEGLENRLTTIERLAARNPSLDVGMLEDTVLAAIPSSDWPAGASSMLSETGATSGMLNSDFSADELANSISDSLNGARDEFSFSSDQSNSPAAVPEPSAFFLAILSAIAAAAAIRRERQGASRRSAAKRRFALFKTHPARQSRFARHFFPQLFVAAFFPQAPRKFARGACRDSGP